MWNYTDEDINNMLGVAFDYIRLNLPQNDIRDIFRKPTQNSNSIFGSKERWNRFFKNHQEIVSSYTEKPIEDYVKKCIWNRYYSMFTGKRCRLEKEVDPCHDCNL